MKNILVVLLLTIGVVANAQSDKPKHKWMKELMITGINAGITSADVLMTQRCLNSGSCVEGNPLVPHSISGKIGVEGGIFFSTTLIAHYERKQAVKCWWLAPVASIGMHTVGIVSGARFH